MHHIEAHIESLHRIVPVDFAVFAFTLFALSVHCKVACEKDGWSSAIAGMGGAGAGGVVSQSSGSASNSV